MKECTNCQNVKSLSEFYKDKKTEDGKSYQCKSCRKEQANRYYENNKTKALEAQKRWRKNNPEKFKESRWAVRYPEKRAQYKREYERNKLKNDEEYKILMNHRHRLNALIDNREVSSRDLLGILCKNFKRYLERQFDDKMNWDNYGTYWHIDHELPCSKFDLTDEKQLSVCFHYSNTQPLEKDVNLKKGNKIKGFEILDLDKLFLSNFNLRNNMR